MGTTGQAFAHNLKIGLNTINLLCEPIDAAHFASFPTLDNEPTDKKIITNHPAFAAGHLATYPRLIAAFLNIEDEAILQQTSCPKPWLDILSKTATCQDDPDNTIYPSKAEILETYNRGFEAVQTFLPDIPDEAFTGPIDDPGRAERFISMGGFMTYLVSGHIHFHAGQISAWRRIMGYGSAM